ncbi:unnamed protein product [Didymodactylos carnosus]|uniref:Uncharacterized protein n=1 Tax=Didymodactylos carnosus TaxID=1234261 RepID=A0A8S2VCH1_9BILA|nr:unnamed protein product [Didymodactylos carnosus]CAF4392102.1 unnamed protein product [Didymodactylos carnosus]
MPLDTDRAGGSTYVTKCVHDPTQIWIWSLDHDNNILSSSSSNYEIRLWDMNEELREISRIKLRHTFAMCHRIENSKLYAGLYDGQLQMYDTRVSNEKIQDIRVSSSKGYIHTLELSDNYLLLLHKPNVLCIYDQRTWNKIEHVQLNITRRASFFKDSLLFLGDSDGYVHVFNWNRDHCEFVEVGL